MSFHGISPLRFGSLSMVTATLGSSDPEIGTRATDSGNDYLFVYNDGTTQISVGNGAVLAAGATGYSCTVTSVAGQSPLGVCYHATLTTATYGWLLTRGFGKATIAASTLATAGEILQLVAAGLWTHKSYVTAPLGATGPDSGKVVTATTSGGICSAYFVIY